VDTQGLDGGLPPGALIGHVDAGDGVTLQRLEPTDGQTKYLFCIMCIMQLGAASDNPAIQQSN
jgi:hypothetical protein